MQTSTSCCWRERSAFENASRLSGGCRGLRSQRPIVFVVLGVALLLAVIPARGWTAEVRVVATTTDVGAVLLAVGGDRVEVTVLAQGKQDPHYLEAKPSYMTSLRKADLLAYNGLQLEIGWLPLLIEGARNRKIRFGASGNLAMSRGVEILEIPDGPVSRAEGDIHPEGNPHYTLDPRNLIEMAKHAELALSRIDAAGASDYARGRESFARRLREAIAGWEERMQPYRGQKIVCYHKQWEYLLGWLGLEVSGYIEDKPGVPPAPRHIRELHETIRRSGVRVILASTFVSAARVERLAQLTRTQVAVLPAAVGAEEGVDDSFALFERITSGLAAAFERSLQ